MQNGNINIQNPNFCNGPISGSICTIDTTNPKTVLKIKGSDGSPVADFNLSSNIVGSDFLGIEYVGPRNVSSIKDGFIFFTAEKFGKDSVVIKRWETNTKFSILNLKESVVKRSSGDTRLNVNSFAVEYVYNSLIDGVSKSVYLKMKDFHKVKNRTRLFLGPSSAIENLGAVEEVMVSHVFKDKDGLETVALSSPTKYIYSVGDKISFYTNIYLFSNDGFGGHDSGSVYRFDPYSWDMMQADSKMLYRRIEAARWNPTYGCICVVVNTSMLFLDPYDGFINRRSMYLTNFDYVSTGNFFKIHDIIFDGYSVWKLQRRVSLRRDDGTRYSYVWATYNYQADSLLPYSKSLTVVIDTPITIGPWQILNIKCQLRDQYNVGLRDVEVHFTKEGDPAAIFSPLSGYVTTDLNGEASILYVTGGTYQGKTDIRAKCGGGLPAFGTPYVFCESMLRGYMDHGADNKVLQRSWKGAGTYVRGLNNTFKFYDPGRKVWVLPTYHFWCKSFYTSPGGDWVPIKHNDGSHNIASISIVDFIKYIPLLYKGEDRQRDTPSRIIPGTQNPFELPPTTSAFAANNTGNFNICNRITQVLGKSGEIYNRSLTDYLVYRPECIGSVPLIFGFHYNAQTGVYYKTGSSMCGLPPYLKLAQMDLGTGSLATSQLHMSKYTHWSDGVAYRKLVTNVRINQFVFVEDAIPKFWSEKNPVETFIWLRLRPFAFDLNVDTLRIWIREVSMFGDTGFYEITNSLSVVGFDAGGGISGLEVLYNTPKNFVHGSLVFVRLEVYDTAYDPNFVYLDYWFYLVNDFKAPYLENLSPGREEDYVSVDSDIYMEILDKGLGVDINSLEVLLNSRLVRNKDMDIEEVNKNHYKVRIRPEYKLYHGKRYKVLVTVNDLSPFKNKLVDSYVFYTVSSEGVEFINHSPGCKRGQSVFEDVSVIVLSKGHGIDKDSIKLQVFDKDVKPNIVPIIYRIC